MRLIDANALRKSFKKSPFFTEVYLYYARQLIDNAPTIEERKKGKWIEGNSETGAVGIKYTWFKCNQCGLDNSLVIPRNYCPNCGAKMIKEDPDGKVD